MASYEDAKREYLYFVRQDMGISSIAKLLDIPRIQIDSPFSEREGLLTEEYVIKEIQKLLEKGNLNNEWLKSYKLRKTTVNFIL